MLTLDGYSLTIREFGRALADPSIKINVSDLAWDRVRQSRAAIDKLLDRESISYGITTGFGSLKDRVIPPDQLEQLQLNLILSHAAGTGNPLPLSRVRGMLILRINTLVKGYSGVTPKLIERLVEFYNYSIFSRVPEQGTVGASGDLAPLAHLMLGYLGEGELWNPKVGKFQPARQVLVESNLPPLRLQAKEGLALINGTQFMTTLLAEAVNDSRRMLDQASSIVGLTIEALRGTSKAFDSRIAECRPHPGQIYISESIRELLDGSERLSTDRIQDAYSLRCVPQVHGAVKDAIDYVEKITQTEINSATDNPLIFGDEVISGGNFHGQYPAMAADFLAIALTTLGNISERRIERLVNGSLSRLPSFLIRENPGLNSGCMIFQYTAAALAAENRTLSNPSSVTSIPTCENQEDHVSMGGFSVRKLLTIVGNVRHILAIELFCGVQAVEMSPGKVSPHLSYLVEEVRKIIPPITSDRYLAEDIERIKKLLK
jgi:histidine ammonia-lyase